MGRAGGAWGRGKGEGCCGGGGDERCDDNIN